MVFREIEHSCRVGRERPGGFKLETGELEYPQGRQAAFVLAAHQRVEHRRSDVAGDFAIRVCLPRHRTGKRRDRALAVGARHGDGSRAPLRRRLGEQLDIADHLYPGDGCAPHARLRWGHSGTDSNEVDSGEAFLAERSAIGRDARERAPQIGEARRRRARIGDAHVCTAARQPLRHRQACVTQTEHQHLSARETHRSFKVDRPNSTSIMVMIQNRTTTCDSFQPESS